MTKSDTLPRIIIVGGGFGGLAAARAPKKAHAQVGLIDKTNHHVFQPLLYQVATGILSPEHIAAPLRQVLGKQLNTIVLKETVIAVDAEKKLCVVEGAPVSLPYDYLVLATGVETSYFGNNEYIPFIPKWNLRGLRRSARVKTTRQKEVAGTCRVRREPADFCPSGKRRRNRWKKSEETAANPGKRRPAHGQPSSSRK